MATDEADPVALTPNTRSDGNLWVQLDAHLEIALQARLWDRIRTRGRRIALEAIDHGVEVSLLGSLDRGWYRSTVDSFMKDRVVGIVFLHGGEVVGAFEQMRTLTRGVFRANRLTVDALRRQTLGCMMSIECWGG